MRTESIELLQAIGAYNFAHQGDSDDDEIEAAYEMEEAALKLVKTIGTGDPLIAKYLAVFEAARNG